MKKTVFSVAFSPAGGTERVAGFLAERIAEALGRQVKKIDFTRPESRARTYVFSEADVVVFGSPVYAGRIPNKIAGDWERCFRGNGAFCIALCTFGNRSFDSALDEFHLLLQEDGFRVAARAAVVCEHVFSNRVGTGRPDEEDWKVLCAFSRGAAEKLKKAEAAEETAGARTRQNDGNPDNRSTFLLPADTVLKPYYTPRKTDGTPANFLKAKPRTRETCTDCSICVKACPMGSIDTENPRAVSGICIKCQACVLKCPVGAKYFSDEEFLSHVKMLEENFSARQETVCMLSEAGG